MVLKTEAVKARLRKLEEVIYRLEQLGPLGAQPDFREAWAAERGLQLAAETVLDIGNHILSAHFGLSAEDYESIIVQLGNHHVIDPDLQSRLKGLGGFRNILVHGYIRLDPEQVSAHLTGAPRNFSDFALAIRSWLDSLLAERR